MRGGFVACLGGNSERIDHVVDRLRWHRGNAVRYHGNGLEVAAYVDAVEGPRMDSHGGNSILVHGGPAIPLAELQRNGTRFAALEWNCELLRATRDPMGLAPLFYRIMGDALWLSTEVALLASLATSRPDPDALSARAAFVPLDERTGWLGIHRVLPGSTLEIAIPSLRMRSSRYWFPEQHFATYRGSYREALDEFQARFDTAVRRCFEPGSAILLSGGLDSAAVAATATACTSGRGLPHLLHVHYPTLPKTHEESYAAAVATSIGAPLHTLSGRLTPWDIGAELDMHGIPYNWLPYGMDEPALAHIAGAGIGIALDGHDGDGVLGPPGRGIWGSLILDGQFRQAWRSFRRYGARRALRGVAADFVPPGLRPRRFIRPTYMHAVAPYFCDPLSELIMSDDIYRWRLPRGLWRARQIQPLLPRAVISFEQKEIEAASHGIDLRHPFADRALVEFLISLPCAIKSDPGRAKPVLVDAMASVLPEIIHERRKSDYMTAVRERVDPATCVELVRASKVRLPQIDYTRLFDDGDSNPENIPLFLLVNLARVHEFARRAQ